MVRIFFFVLFFCCFTSKGVFAENPNDIILRAKELYVKSTQLGRLYAGRYERDHGPSPIRFSSFQKEYVIRHSMNGLRLQMNMALRPSEPEYLSWILFQGLVKYDLDKKLGTTKLPRLIEMDYYIFKKSMEYLDQSGIIIHSDIDFAHHPFYSFARNRILSIEDFYSLWQSDEELFLEAVYHRRQKLDDKVLSVDEYLKRTDLSVSDREAGQKLKNLWQRI